MSNLVTEEHDSLPMVRRETLPPWCSRTNLPGRQKVVHLAYAETGHVIRQHSPVNHTYGNSGYQQGVNHFVKMLEPRLLDPQGAAHLAPA